MIYDPKQETKLTDFKIPKQEGGHKMSEENKKYEKKFRCGNVTATIWKNTVKGNDGKDFDTMSTSIVKNYKDKEDAWKTTNSFNVNELGKVSIVTRKAQEFILLKEE